jgi:hypothetical protein
VHLDEVSGAFSLTLGECMEGCWELPRGASQATMMLSDYTPRGAGQARAGSSGSSCGRRAQSVNLNDCYWLAETTKRR